MSNEIALHPTPQPTAGRSGTPEVRRHVVWYNAAFLTLTPIAAVVAVPWYALTVGVTWVEIAACATLWVVVGLSVTAGYHRLFTHRAYEASAPVRALFAVLGAAALENSVIAWAAAHRFHHRFVDSDDDPYNPQEGFWYSHMGWIIVKGAKHDDTSDVPDLWKDPICRWQHRHYLALAVAVNVLITVGLGLATGHMLGMVVFALLLRVVLTHHFTFLINSAAHLWGSQRWSTGHSARDNWALSFLTFGEGYHNYHHTFQADYRNGALWYNWDPTKWLIWTLAKLHLAGCLRRSPVDVRFGQLFAQALGRFQERLAGVGESLEGLRERATAAGANARASLTAQIVAAQRQCEETLAELKAVNARWQAALRAGTRFRPEARTLHHRLCDVRRSARSSLRTWQQLAGAYLEGRSGGRVRALG
jgi:stearoyl-CoA desaturase (delta-9 desaturase)